MIEYQLQPKDSTLNYKGKQIRLINFTKNLFTGTWTFDLHYPNGSLLGVPISAGTSIIKGNGTPFYKLIFLDNGATGDIKYPANSRMYILEENIDG